MMDNKMTLFYSKRTGEIKNYQTGISDMGFYGDDEEDFSKIWDYIVVDRDDYVLDNVEQFKVVNEKIKLKETVDLNKYL
ncbi:hypothetical protein [Anaerosalibacter massiliensis]|uniref:Uncharacterized protein n=1 Tax=Anaerosalibacter massiliensis TaxID=1347392 RepID=A0A9X2S8W1_9FIRM|nr:hypothetical protein [Anaerosalibacter massiliensis]MCR2045481.1 hypothetical protein [Anaerosalibacter massiliensis]